MRSEELLKDLQSILDDGGAMKPDIQDIFDEIAMKLSTAQQLAECLREIAEQSVQTPAYHKAKQLLAEWGKNEK